VRAGRARRLHDDRPAAVAADHLSAFEEATALRIGWAYQQATDWHERRPPGLD
jgi:hypothetical protein